MAHDAREVATLATDVELAELTARSSVCRACPRLVLWREQVASTKRRSFADEPYWGRPVPGWGDPDAYILIVGLAPTAHGAGTAGSSPVIAAATGCSPRCTGPGWQRSRHRFTLPTSCGWSAPGSSPPSDVLRQGMHRAGRAGHLRAWLDREVELMLGTVRAVIALGSFAWAAALGALGRNGFAIPRPRPAFGHGAEAVLRRSSGSAIRLIGVTTRASRTRSPAS